MIEDHISIFDFNENTIQGAVSTFILTIPYIFQEMPPSHRYKY
jgi:hypothetical protein